MVSLENVVFVLSAAGKLNQMLDAATFNTAAVDNTKTTLSGGAITIAPNAISFSELSDGLVNDTDTMTDASATTLATSESIKAYIDSSRPGLWLEQRNRPRYKLVVLLVQLMP